MKNFMKVLTVTITIMIGFSLTLIAALPEVIISPDGKTVTMKFKNGPKEEAENNVIKCPFDTDTHCQTIVSSSEKQILGPSGYLDQGSYYPAGSQISIFFHNNPNNPNIGTGLINITLTDDYYYMQDDEAGYFVDPSQTVINDYAIWQSLVY